MRGIYTDPLRDMQRVAPTGSCERCGCELYGDEELYCHVCRAELDGYDAETVTAVMQAMDAQLRRYLSDNIRDTVWNAVSSQFPKV